MGSENLHERQEVLSDHTQDQHRAISSLMEELEAVDWYQQRVEGASDPELAEILAHNRDEEIEHAAMVLEWLRRRVPKFDEELKTYLFKDGSIIAAEASATDGAGPASSDDGQACLGIGSLRGEGL